LLEAFPVNKITATAEKLLHCDRFDVDLLQLEVDSDSDENSSSDKPSDSIKDSDSSESKREFFQRSKLRRADT
jgi:hypothetical protein